MSVRVGERWGIPPRHFRVDDEFVAGFARVTVR
jgi:hypothetical protein